MTAGSNFVRVVLHGRSMLRILAV